MSFSNIDLALVILLAAHKLIDIANLLSVSYNILIYLLKYLLSLVRKSEYPKKTAPSFYQVTNNSKERPDVWIESPEKLAF